MDAGADLLETGEIFAALERACDAPGPAGRGPAAFSLASRERLLPRGSSVLVACSGGADSVALAAALCELARARPELELRVALGHVDHGLRPESRAESERVEALAAKLGTPFFLEVLDAAALQEAVEREGLEGGARALRYPALERLAFAAGCGRVATGHTRSDQAETVLMRLARGGSLGALAGIRASRPLGSVLLVRPLLSVPRAATERFCRARGLGFTDDPHNRDPARVRARVRQSFASLREQLNPRLEESLAAAAQDAAEEDALLDALARAGLSRAAPVSNLETRSRAEETLAGSALAWRLDALSTLPAPLLRRALLVAANDSGVRPERAHLEQLCARVRLGRGALDLPGGRADLRAGLLRFQKRNALACASPAAPAPQEIAGPGRYSWGSSSVEVMPAAPSALAEGAGLYIDVERAPFPWTLRTLAPGDRLRPARGHLKKVSDLWIDAKVPRELRAQLPLLADASGELFFAAGLRPAAAALGPYSRAVAVRWSAGWTAALAVIPDSPIRVEQRATEPRATIRKSFDEEPV